MVTSWLPAVLGGGAGLTVLLGAYDRVRNRKFDRRKQEVGIDLDEATYTEIQARAEQTTNASLMAVGAFWQGQFDELSRRFEALEVWKRGAQERMHDHRQWDKMVMRKMTEAGHNVDPPPSLDPDERNGA